MKEMNLFNGFPSNFMLISNGNANVFYVADYIPIQIVYNGIYYNMPGSQHLEPISTKYYQPNSIECVLSLLSNESRCHVGAALSREQIGYSMYGKYCALTGWTFMIANRREINLCRLMGHFLNVQCTRSIYQIKCYCLHSHMTIAVFRTKIIIQHLGNNTMEQPIGERLLYAA